MEQLNGLGRADLVEVAQQRNQQQRRKQNSGLGHAGPGDIEAEGDRHIHHLVEKEADQLVQQHSHCEAAADAQNADIERFKDQHHGDVPLPHAEDIIQAQLPGPLLHEEAIDIEHKDGGEEKRDEHADGHEHLHIHVAVGVAGGDVFHAGVVDQGGHDVDGRHVPQQGQDVGEVEFPAAADVLQGQLGIEGRVTHPPHLLRPGG